MEILIACGVFSLLGATIALLLGLAAKCFFYQKAIPAPQENLAPEKGESTPSDDKVDL